MSPNGVTIIVLTWNGIELVKECLPSVLDAVACWDIPREVILVDNGSKDETIQYVKKKWPAVKTVVLDRNTGFAHANNEAAKQAQYDTLLFLNNDLILEEGFISPMFDGLSDEKVFAVAPKILRWDRKTIDDGLRYGEFENGLFSVHLDINKERVNVPHWVTFFCGACFRMCIAII